MNKYLSNIPTRVWIAAALMFAGSLYIAYDDYVNDLEPMINIVVSLSISCLLVLGLILRSNLTRIITLIFLFPVVLIILLLGSFNFLSTLIVISGFDLDVIITIMFMVTIFTAIGWIFLYLLSKESKDWFTKKGSK